VKDKLNKLKNANKLVSTLKSDIRLNPKASMFTVKQHNQLKANTQKLANLKSSFNSLKAHLRAKRPREYFVL
jgi:hypothetical protein